MRKAFKFIEDSTRSSKNSKSKPKYEEERKETFATPFRKNCSEKTMNSQFLKHTFSSSSFVAKYK